MSPTGARFEISYDAIGTSVGAARIDLFAFLARSGVSAEVIDSVRLAVSEALTNAVVHAYRPGTPGLIHVTAAIAGRELSVIVADDGCGLGCAPDSPGLGLGLNLIEQSCHSLTITMRPSGGTQLEMRFPLSNNASSGDPQQAEGVGSRVPSLNPLRLAAFLHDCPVEGSP